MTDKKTAEQRVADLRAERKAAGEDVSHLSDLDILNEFADQRAAECTNTRDRYMGLLREQRIHGERVRAATNRTLQERINVIAVHAVERHVREAGRLVAVVEALPEKPKPEQLARLRDVASSVKHMLELLNEDGGQWRLDNSHDLVNHARRVIGVLGARDGIAADEVIRLVGEALKPNGNLHELFTVADTGTLKPEFGRRHPQFFGADWVDRNHYYAYEPDGTGARVVAYGLGDDWYLDLYSPTGALLAYGVTTEQQVATVAQALVDGAPAMVGDGLYPWQRYERQAAELERALGLNEEAA